ncbi:MAG: twin transmembrane helix small protein [Pseudomonadota bacterium]
MNVMLILVIVFAILTAGILITGIITMARGSDITGKQSNKMMQARVVAQAATVVLVLIMLAIAAD